MYLKKKRGALLKKKIFFGVYNPSIILTYISVFSALYGIVCIMNQKFATMLIPVIALVVSGVCDMFDGTIARKCKRTEIEKEFGIQLDSLADTVAFVVYPVIMLLYWTNYHAISIVISCFYVFAGIMRLGWFNVTTEENKGVFQGIPVTSIAIILPLIYMLCTKYAVQANVYAIIMQALFTAVGLLFIANIKIAKPTHKARVILCVLAIILIVLLFI